MCFVIPFFLSYIHFFVHCIRNLVYIWHWQHSFLFLAYLRHVHTLGPIQLKKSGQTQIFSCLLPSCLLLLFFLLSSLTSPLASFLPSWYSLLVKYLGAGEWVLGAGRPKLGGSAKERLQLLWISCLFYHNTTACVLGVLSSPGKLHSQNSPIL